MYSNEGGVRSFYKGLSPSLIGIVPQRALYFCSYHQYTSWCKKASCFNDQTAILFSGMCASMNVNCFDKIYSSHDIYFHNIIGLTANMCTSPLWMIKIKLQLDTQR